MEVDIIEAQIVELTKTFGRMDAHNADAMRALAYADDLELFWIVNTAGKKAYFLARTSRFARHAALRTNHIQDIDNGECYRAPEQFYAREPGFGSSVKRAIAARIPGHIVKKGNHAVMGEHVYSPLSAVK